MSQLTQLDWFNFKSTAPTEYKRPEQYTIAGKMLSDKQLKEKYINQLYRTCMMCSLCNLGNKSVVQDGFLRDPHLLSNQTISNIMIVMDQPEWSDLLHRDNAVDTELTSSLKQYNIYDRVYVTFLLKCAGQSVNQENYSTCQSYIDLEIKSLKPVLIITVGPKVFDYFKTQNDDYASCLKTIIKSKYNCKMLPICDVTNDDFDNSISMVSKLIRAINER